MKLYSPYNFQKVYLDEKIYENEEEIKFGFININSLYTSNSDEFLNEDQNLIELDIIAVGDTRLEENNSMEDLEKRLSNWKILHRLDSDDNMKHMGLLLLQSRKNPKNITVKVGAKTSRKRVDGEKIVFLQCLKVNIPEYAINIAFVYIRQSPTQTEVTLLLKILEDVDLLLGDLNLDPMRTEDLKKLNSLCAYSHSRVLNELTTTHFNQLDHIFFDGLFSPAFFTSSFRNFSSDHHTITIRLPLPGNNFSDLFLQRYNFNKERERALVKQIGKF